MANCASDAPPSLRRRSSGILSRPNAEARPYTDEYTNVH